MSETDTVPTTTSIEELERRVSEMEASILGYQPASSDDLLRIPLPLLTSASSSSSASPLLSRRKTLSSSGSHGSTVADQFTTTSISEYIERHKATLTHIKAENDIINQYLNMYKDNETLFNNITENESILPSVEKLAIILNSEDDIRQTARQLQLLSELEKFINTSSTSLIPTSITKLHPITSLHNEQEAITIALNKKLEQNIQSYNDIIEGLSSRFAYWDLILSEYESQLNIKK